MEPARASRVDATVSLGSGVALDMRWGFTACINDLRRAGDARPFEKKNHGWLTSLNLTAIAGFGPGRAHLPTDGGARRC